MTYEVRPTGVIGGGQVGFNWQADWLAAGVETDFQNGVHDSRTINLPGENGFPPTISKGKSTLEWFGTLRARFGFTLSDQLLLYATGGYAYGRVKDKASLIAIPSDEANFKGSASKWNSGWTIGGGGEYAFNRHWSLKLEYLYVDLGHNIVRLADPHFPIEFLQYSFTHRENIVRTGINYCF